MLELSGSASNDLQTSDLVLSLDETSIRIHTAVFKILFLHGVLMM